MNTDVALYRDGNGCGCGSIGAMLHDRAGMVIATTALQLQRMLFVDHREMLGVLLGVEFTKRCHYKNTVK